MFVIVLNRCIFFVTLSQTFMPQFWLFFSGNIPVTFAILQGLSLSDNDERLVLKTPMHRILSSLIIRNLHNRLDGCKFALFETLLICVQCSDNNFGIGQVSRYVFYAPGETINLSKLTFYDNCQVFQAQKKIIVGDKCLTFCYDQLGVFNLRHFPKLPL